MLSLLMSSCLLFILKLTLCSRIRNFLWRDPQVRTRIFFSRLNPGLFCRPDSQVRTRIMHCLTGFSIVIQGCAQHIRRKTDSASCLPVLILLTLNFAIKMGIFLGNLTCEKNIEMSVWGILA